MYRKVSVFVVIAAIVISSWVALDARAEDAPEVLRITPTGDDVPIPSQIIVEFSRAMVPVGRMDRSNDEIPITITPAIKCQWRWLNTKTLACQIGEADSPIPANKYVVSVKKTFADDKGVTISGEREETFITARPKVVNYWLEEWKSPAFPRVAVTFNYPVERAQVEKFLFFGGSSKGKMLVDATPANENDGYYGDEKAFPFHLIKEEKKKRESKRAWTVSPKKEFALNETVELKVRPGLRTLLGTEGGIEDRVIVELQTFPKFAFQGLKCTDSAGDEVELSEHGDDSGAQQCDPLRGVSLIFTSPVLKEELQQHLKSLPDFAGGRTDYNPWENVYSYSMLNSPVSDDGRYYSWLPPGLKAFDTYKISVPANSIKDEFGRTLSKPIDLTFKTSHRNPRYVFENEVSMLESSVDTHVPVAVTNIDSLNLNYSMQTAAGTQLNLNQNIPVDKGGPAEDVSYYFPVKLRNILGGKSGMVKGVLSSNPQPIDQRPEKFMIQVTPYQVHVKYGHFNTLVWVTDLATGQPVSGATVGIYRDETDTFVDAPASFGSATTDKDGVAMLPGSAEIDPKLETPEYSPYGDSGDQRRWFVKVDKGGELSYVPLLYPVRLYPRGANDEYINSSSEQILGHLRAWGTTPQGVYKLGETIDYKLFVRNESTRSLVGAPKSGYTGEMVDPTGKVVCTDSSFALSDFGTFSGSCKIPESASVGYYQYRLSSTLSDEKWQPFQVLVADFTPAAFRVSTQIDRELVRIKDVVKATSFAKLHAGGPYSSANAKLTVTNTATALPELNAPNNGFYFATTNSSSEYETPEAETIFEKEDQLNEQGEHVWDVPVNETQVLYGQMLFESNVRDDRGRYLAGRTTSKFAARDRYVGLRTKGWVLEKGKEAVIDTLVVDENGKPVAGTEARVTVRRKERVASRVKGAGNAYLTHYEEVDKEVATCTTISKETAVQCRFTPDAPGEYFYTAEVTDTQNRSHSTKSSQYAIGSGDLVWNTDEGNLLEIIPEKKSYAVGDKAKFLVKNPFPKAKALISVERYGVNQHWIEEFTTQTPVVTIPVTANHIPGFYVSIVVTSPRVDQPLTAEQVDLGKPAMRMGYAQIEVRDSAKELAITATARKKEYRPGDEVTVDLTVSPRKGANVPTELAVGVLDEAVFDLIATGKDYFDPYKGLYKLQPLDLRNYNVLTHIIGKRKYEKKGAHSGGDGPGADKAREFFKFVSYWNPSIPVGTDGKATISFKAPDNLTGWRVLALGISKEDLTGVGDGTFAVNQPLEIRSSLPNQVHEGDQFGGAFTFMNRTQKERTFKVKLTASGSLKAAAQSEEQISLKPFERKTVRLPVQAGAVGKIAFAASATDGEISDAIKTEMPVLRIQALEVGATYGSSTEPNIREMVKMPEGIRTDVGELSVVTAPSVIGNVAGAFAYLRDYPYLCWEQRLTKGVMAANFQALKNYIPTSVKWEEAPKIPEMTLESASSFQAPNGGMCYFIASDEYSDPYLSAYTALAFHWMKQLKYTVPVDVEDRLHFYLKELLQRDVMPTFYNTGMASTVRAVALAALAHAGKATKEDFVRYLPHLKEMSLFGKANMLDAAVTLGIPAAEGRQEIQNAISAMGNETGGKLQFLETIDDGFDRILATPLRDNCEVVMALLTRPEAKTDDSLPKIVRFITQSRGNRDHWENTQENVFCMNALAAYSRVFETETPNMSLQVKDNNESIGTTKLVGFQDSPQTIQRSLRENDPGTEHTVDIDKSGPGRYYYSVRLAYSLKELKTEPVLSGMEVRREYSVRRDGKWELLKTPFAVKPGELLKVDLFISLPAARNFVVVNDPVPGGLEPVNRDLNTASVTDADRAESDFAGGSAWFQYDGWISYGVSRWSFYHKEYRHDSVRFYSDYLPAGKYHLSYVTQTVGSGSFAVLPTKIEEMYDPDVYGLAVPEQLTISE